MGLKEVSSIIGGSLSGAQSALGIVPSYPTKIVKFRLALANVRNGTSDARILCVGDSTTSGYGSAQGATLPNLGSWPTRLSQLMNSSITPCANGMIVPPTSAGSGTDNRWTLNSWIVNTYGAGGAGGASSAGPSTNLVCTPGVLADSYYVYYCGGSGFGLGTSLTFTATGGSGVNVNPTSQPSGGIYRTLCTASSASTSNTVTITAANGAAPNANIIVGVEPVLSTKKQILVGNAGEAGTSASSWAGGAGVGFYGDALIKAVAPDLTIISLGINDAVLGQTTAQLTTNLQVLINAAQVSGNVILLDMPPSSNAPYNTAEPGYITAIQNLATSNNLIYASIYSRFGGSYNTPFMSDNLHPNNQGYWDWAQYMQELLFLI